MRSIVVLLSCMSSVAGAHPCDDQWPDACVDPSAQVASDVMVGFGVDLGPYVSAEAGVVLTRQAMVAGRQTGTAPVRLGRDTVVGRRTTIGFDASIGAGVTFLPLVSAGDDLRAEDNVVVGVATVIGDKARLGEGAVVGSRSLLGDAVVVQPNARLSRSVAVDDGAQVSGYVGPTASVGAGAVLQSGVRVNKGAQVGDGVRMGAFSRVGRSATVEDGALIGEDARIRSGGLVCEGAVVEAGQVIRRNEVFPEDGSCAVCDEPSDCASGVCDDDGTCGTTCDDGVLNGDETGVDCGGPECGQCDLDITCDTVSDCISGFCGLGDDGTCGTAVCTDGTPESWGAVLTCVVDDGVVYEVQTYADSGSYGFTLPVSDTPVDVLMVAGGGGSGGSIRSWGGGGGGGAGGLRFVPETPLVRGVPYALTVGAGGAAGVTTTRGENGGNTTFDGDTVLGGGGGGTGGPGGGAASTGGSGGGAGYRGYRYQAGAAGSAGQGNNGGDVLSSNWSAGGGGAGGRGQDQVATNGCTGPVGCPVNGGLGGVGLVYDISGIDLEYARGGDGSIGAATDSQSGARGTGNGANGSYAAANGGRGGVGGVGTVVVRYPARDAVCEVCDDDVLCDEVTDCASGVCSVSPDGSCVDAGG